MFSKGKSKNLVFNKISKKSTTNRKENIFSIIKSK